VASLKAILSIAANVTKHSSLMPTDCQTGHLLLCYSEPSVRWVMNFVSTA